MIMPVIQGVGTWASEMGIWISPVEWKWIYISILRATKQGDTNIRLTRIRRQDNSVSPVSSCLLKAASLSPFLFIRRQ